ncbi:MAG: glycosyltransferase family 2 protein [Christensenellaceae bacterium]|jgi:glycosyltransferase involved in cell wall biosynthesis|nr:glycosyltransferase family 2 protein [Christensenellaceae bacterium]
MDKILSVIVPTYNMEKYLKECLNSFIDDRLLDKIEVLIINDGSKDASEAIANSFVDKYPKTFKLINKENGGHGSTINKGIDVAIGKYFKCVDSDDFVDADALSHVVSYLEIENIDCCITDYNSYFMQSKTYKRSAQLKIEKGKVIYDTSTLPVDVLQMHRLIYKTEILRANNIRLSEHCFYADVEYVLFPIPFIKTAAYIDAVVYQYRLEREGQSVSREGYIKHISNLERIVRSVFNFLNLQYDTLANHSNVFTLTGTLLKTFYDVTYIKYGKKRLREMHKSLYTENQKVFSKLIMPLRIRVYIKLNFHFVSIFYIIRETGRKLLR